MATWPPELPDNLLVAGYRRQLGKQTLRTEMDAGPAKQRRRFSAVAVQVSGALFLSKEQAQALETFYVDTLLGGAEAFEWKHPVTGAIVQYRFVEPYEEIALSGNNLFRATLSLEILP